MTQSTIERWHNLASTRDIQGLDSLLSDEVVFFSPVVHSPQRGKAITSMYLTAAFQVLFNETFQYTKEVVGESQAILEFEVEIDGIAINGVDIISWNPDGLITEFKVMIRPLKAVNLVHAQMKAMLEAFQ